MPQRRSVRVGAVLAVIIASGFAAAAPASAPEPASGDGPAAVIGSLVIPRAELDRAAKPALDSAQLEYDTLLRRSNLKLKLARAEILAKAVERLEDDRVLALEADAQHATRDELLSRVPLRPVSDADVKRLYDARQVQIGRPFDDVKDQIRAYLEAKSREEAEATYLAYLRAKYHAESRLEPLRFAVDAAGPARGPASAPVTIVEFADFECPYCGAMEPIVRELGAAYSTQVRLVFRHLPLTSLHPHAFGAARAAVCAERQGRFWNLHDAMYADQSALSDEQVRASAVRVGVDAGKLEQCLASGKPEEVVLSDVAAADALGLAATPAFFVNGRLINGAVDPSAFRAIIDDELARTGRGSRATASISLR